MQRSYFLAILLSAGLSLVVLAESTSVPRAWDEAALEDWAIPVAGLNARPSHFSPAEYYRAPVDNLRTYPVYYPGREPAGYWDMLQTVGPKPLVELKTRSNDADWARDGKRVFEEWDVPGLRVFEPQATW